ADGGTLVAEFDATPPLSAATPLGREFTLQVTNELVIRGSPRLEAGGRYLLAVRRYGAYRGLGNYTGSVDRPVGLGPPVPSACPPRLPGYGARYEVRGVGVPFARPTDPSTFSAAAGTLVGPAGPIAVSAPVVVNPADPRAFDIFFPVQRQVGVYTMTIGPHIS